MAQLIRPEYISFENWAGSIVTSYERYVIPLLMEGQSWQDWANDLLSVPPFQGNSIPAPQETEEWQDWARNFYLIATTKEL